MKATNIRSGSFRSRPSALRKPLLYSSLVMVSAAILYCTLSGVGIGLPYRQVSAIGPVQMLGNKDEAWIFVDKTVWIIYPGWFPRTPRSRRIGLTQEIFIITPKGVKQRLKIPRWQEVSFHTNSSRIFRHDNTFFLLQGGSLTYHRS